MLTELDAMRIYAFKMAREAPQFFDAQNDIVYRPTRRNMSCEVSKRFGVSSRVYEISGMKKRGLNRPLL